MWMNNTHTYIYIPAALTIDTGKKSDRFSEGRYVVMMMRVMTAMTIKKMMMMMVMTMTIR